MKHYRKRRIPAGVQLVAIALSTVLLGAAWILGFCLLIGAGIQIAKLLFHG